MAILLAMGTISFAQDDVLATAEPVATAAVIAVDIPVVPVDAVELSIADRLVNSLENRNTTQTLVLLVAIAAFMLVKVTEIVSRGEDPVQVLAETLEKLTTPGGAAQVQQEIVQSGVDTLEALILKLPDARRAAIAHAVMTLSDATDYDEDHPELVAELYKLVNEVGGDVNAVTILDSLAGASLTPADGAASS